MNSGKPLWQQFDAIGFDLDGVIYRGPKAVPGAPETLDQLRRLGMRVGYVTNNAARPPQTVADQLVGFGVTCTADDVVTSAQATAHLMVTLLPAGAEVLIVGTQALADEIATVGLHPVWQRSDGTVAVIVGFDPTMTWEQMNQGCYAVQHGAVYFACNNDLTRPTDQGIAVGMGAILLAMAAALDVEPIMGGNPARPLLDEARGRLGASHPLFVGDRLDTDIEGAFVAQWSSLFVLSGSQGPSDLVAAPPHQRPDFVASDISGLLEAPRLAFETKGAWACGGAVACNSPQGQLVVDGRLASLDDRLDGLWAVANAAWAAADRGEPCDVAEALARIGSFSGAVL